MARSRRQPENEILGMFARMSRPFRAYRHIILCRDLRPQSPSSCLAFRTTSEGDIEARGLAAGWEKERVRKPPISRVIYVKRGRKATYTISLDGGRHIVGKASLVFKAGVISWGY